MSGSATLRICLATMAPALTEAASTGLKLQEDNKSKLRRVSSNTEIRKFTDSTIRFKRHSLDISSDCGLGSNKSINNFCNLTNQGFGETESFNPKSIYFASVRFKSDQSVSSKELKIDNFYQVTEDFQIASGTNKSNKFGNLKSMNQPQTAAEREVDSSCSVTDASKRAGLAEMVNGDVDHVLKSDVEGLNGCNERGDAGFKARKYGVKFESPNHLLKDSSSMGFQISGERNQHIPMAYYKSPKFNMKEITVDEKMTDEMRKDCVKKQAYLERRTEALIRRLKRMKGKVVETHTKEQLRHFVNYHHKNLQKVAKTIKRETPGPEELKEHFLSNEEVKNMSTSQLVKLVKSSQSNANKLMYSMDSVDKRSVGRSAVSMDPTVRIQSSLVSEQLAQRVEITRSELDSDATASSSGGESGDEDSVPVPKVTQEITLPSLTKRAEWKYAVDRAAVVSRWTWLQAQVSDLEYRIRQQSQVYRQLRSTKGGVVLGDPPSALDLFRRLQGLPSRAGQASEGKTLDSSPGTEISPSGSVSAVLSNIDKQALRLTQSLGNCLTPANSNLGSPAGSLISPSARVPATESPISSHTDAENASENSPAVSESRLEERLNDLINQTPQPPSDQTCQSARCRPLRSYRKRKILRTVGLYKSNVKAARLSDIRCRCYPPGGSCPMCGGRYNNVQTIDADSMSFKEKVAILDPSFHPVLSFPQDVHLPIHCEGLLKSGHWQHKHSRKARLAEYKKQNVITIKSEIIPPKTGNGKKQQNGKNNNTSSVINFTAKIKKRYDPKGKKSSNKVKVTSAKAAKKQRVKKKKRKAAKLARANFKKHHPDEYDVDEFEALYLEHEAANPVGPGHRDSLNSSSGSLINKERRKKVVDNSFDINNIVIPLSMATNTIVEQPKYKEIVTPKWREVEDKLASCKTSLSQKLEKTNGVSLHDHNSHPSPHLTEDEEEDLSDERFAKRHSKLEQEEKKRHRNYIVYPPVRRQTRRSDTIEENHDAGEGFSESESRPSTPMLNKSYQSFSLDESTDDLHNHSRRRQSCREELHNHFIPQVEPWPRRSFPLSEQDFSLLSSNTRSRCEPVYQGVNPCNRITSSGKVYVGGSAPTENGEYLGRHCSEVPVEDPNDPEWVGEGGGYSVGFSSSKKSRHRRIMYDDPSDPEWSGSDHKKKGKNKR